MTTTISREAIGVRVARWRVAGGLTQPQLAMRVSEFLGRHYGQSMISAIEGGREVHRRDVLLALAHALRVSPFDLTGQPYPVRTSSDMQMYMTVPLVRAALDEADEPITPRGVEALRAAVDQAMAARMACDYATLGDILPGVLAELRILWQTSADPVVGELLVRACVTGSLALKPAGHIDLAWRLADLAAATAGTIDDPFCRAAADYTIAQAALASGNRRRSLTLAEAAAGRLDSLGGDSPDRFAWLTMLHLHAGLSAASLHQAVDAEGHLAQAGVFADRVTGDPWLMEAGPANVGVWAVGFALENGDAGRAPELARRVDVSRLRTNQRRARLYMDTARGYFVMDDHDAAIRTFLAADAAAPGDLALRPSAVEVILRMFLDAPVRGGSEALRDLAVRVGIDPLAPEPVV